MTDRYELATAPPARRALSDRLLLDITTAAAEFITGPLLDNPYRLGKRLNEELTGSYSARLARDCRVLYEINEPKHVVIVLDIRHRSIAYRPGKRASQHP